MKSLRFPKYIRFIVFFLILGMNSIQVHAQEDSSSVDSTSIVTNSWNKPGEKRSYTNTTGHNWSRFIFNTGASVIVAYGAKSALKAMIKSERPDHSDDQSFPSGHASMAFAAARSIDKEFRRDNIWIPIAGYAAATAIGVERIVSDRHHWYDVVAGAAVGFGAAELTWWLSDKLFPQNKNVVVGTSGNTVDVAVRF